MMGGGLTCKRTLASSDDTSCTPRGEGASREQERRTDDDGERERGPDHDSERERRRKGQRGTERDRWAEGRLDSAREGRVEVAAG